MTETETRSGLTGERSSAGVGAAHDESLPSANVLIMGDLFTNGSYPILKKA
jgi:hypothetical protein